MKSFLHYINSREMIVVAHRGASMDAPDNSLSAFELAIKVGADAIECDVQLTRDKYIVAYHDFHHNSSDLPINQTDFDEIRKINIAEDDSTFEVIPSLDEVIGLANGKANLIIELKILEHQLYPDDIDIIVKKVIDNDYALHTVFVSFHYEVLAYIKQKYPKLYVGVIKIPGDSTLPTKILNNFHFETYICNIREINRDLLDDISKTKAILGVYGVDSIEDLELAQKYGIIAIGTNYPKRIIDYLKK